MGAFFDELAKWGVRNVVISPGSRSTPLSMIAYELSCRAPQRMSTYVDIDERGAAFLALGMAKASGRPAALVCSSGTAIADRDAPAPCRSLLRRPGAPELPVR